HVRSRVVTRVADVVLPDDRASVERRRQAAVEDEVLRERADLADLALGIENALVALPALAVGAERRGGRRDTAVESVLRRAPSRVVVRVALVRLRKEDVVEAAGDEE